MPEHTNECVSSWHRFDFLVKEKPTFCLINSIFTVFQNLTTLSIAWDTTEAWNQFSSSLTKAAVDRHLLSNLPAVNIRMIQIPFTIEYYIERKQNQWLNHIRWRVIQLHSAVVLTTVTSVGPDTHNLCSQAQFHSILHQFKCLTLGNRWYTT